MKAMKVSVPNVDIEIDAESRKGHHSTGPKTPILPSRFRTSSCKCLVFEGSHHFRILAKCLRDLHKVDARIPKQK